MCTHALRRIGLVGLSSANVNQIVGKGADFCRKSKLLGVQKMEIG